jgi:hypothetical protein
LHFAASKQKLKCGHIGDLPGFRQPDFKMEVVVARATLPSSLILAKKTDFKRSSAVSFQRSRSGICESLIYLLLWIRQSFLLSLCERALSAMSSFNTYAHNSSNGRQNVASGNRDMNSVSDHGVQFNYHNSHTIGKFTVLT